MLPIWPHSNCAVTSNVRTISLGRCRLLVLAALLSTLPSSAFSADSAFHSCTSPAAGTPIESPMELRSHNGRLQASLSLHNSLDSEGRMQFCYLDKQGHRSPTLSVRPGDLLVLKLTNNVKIDSKATHSSSPAAPTSSCTTSMMAPDITNLHFHGLSVPPTCHGDDTLHTFIAASSKPFVYRIRIPRHQPPGLYWYHPHPHGHSEEQVLGGASGALIIEGIASAKPVVTNLPERVLVLRDQKLSATLAKANGDPTIPAKDLSINFVPVPYPEYRVGIIATAPEQREFWRVLNASADTYVNLGIIFNGEWKDSELTAVHGRWQKLGLVAVDGVPIPDAAGQGVSWRDEIPIPPGGRAEFIVQTPPDGVTAELFTAGAETNPPNDEDSPAIPSGDVPDRDDFTPPRPLARIVSSRITPSPPPLNEAMISEPGLQVADLARTAPMRQRKLYFSEKVMDAKHPETSTIFYLTEDGHTPKAFDPRASAPDIVVHQGDIEDWTIENRSLESHAFHIHQVHFLLLERDGEAVEKYFGDTIDVPYWDGTSKEYPSVKLRMDFRNPNIVGIFPYHCHILQHVDGGMMGLIEVRSKNTEGAAKKPTPAAPAH